MMKHNRNVLKTKKVYVIINVIANDWVIKMILSVSRRTDIPAFYSEWFFERLREGYALVRNPMNSRLVSRVDMTRDNIDFIVFWSKDPSPMLSRLDELDGIDYYFQFTLNAYGMDIEPRVPKKGTYVIDVFRRLSERIGKERVLWRYDPILISKKYSADYHIEYFSRLAEKLKGYTERCTVSMLDMYSKISSRAEKAGIRCVYESEEELIAEKFSAAAEENGIRLAACCESGFSERYGIERASCIDPELIGRIKGCEIRKVQDRSRRGGCGCISCVDIGAYDTCRHGCVYCYACGNRVCTEKPTDMLCGCVHDDDVIKPLERPSVVVKQFSL